MNRGRKLPVAALLALLLALGAWLRLRGLAYGLPAVYNMDEVAIMSRTLALSTSGLNPGNFLYPSLYFYVLFGWIGLVFVAAWLTGSVASLQAFATAFFVDPSLIYLSGRLFTAALGTATLAAVFALGRRLHGTGAGLAACAFLAVAPIAVQDAHYVKHDVPVTLLVTLAQVMMVAAVAPHRPSDGLRALLWAAVLTGLAWSTHYYTVFLAVPLLLAALWAPTPAGSWAAGRPVRRSLVACAIAIACFVAGSPFLLANWETALRDIAANRAIVINRADTVQGGWAEGAARYAGMLWTMAMGWPVVALAIGGAAVLGRRAGRLLVLVLAFPVLFFWFIGGTVVATRYLNPVLPTLAALAGVAAVFPASRVGATSRPVAARWALVLIVLLAASPGLVAAWRLGAFFRQDDTRSLALAYFERHVPPGATVLIQPYSVPLRQSREGLREALTRHLGDPASASIKFQHQLALNPYPAPAYRLLWLGEGGLDVDKIYLAPPLLAQAPLSSLRRHDVEYVVLKRYNAADPATAPLEAALGREAERLATFSPYPSGMTSQSRQQVPPFLHNTDARLDPRLERPGPIVDIWRIPAATAR